MSYGHSSCSGGPSGASPRIREALRGDEAAVGWLVEHLSPLLRAQARLRLSTDIFETHADDLLQDTWAVFLEKRSGLGADSFPDGPTFIAWMCRTQTNIANNLLRRRITESRRRASLPQGPPSSDSDEDPHDRLRASVTSVLTRLDRSEKARAIELAMKSLDDGDRAVLLLRGLEGRPYDEIAEELRIKPNTAAQQYRRVLMRMRELLPEYGADFFES